MVEKLETDVLIVGGGLAGDNAAIGALEVPYFSVHAMASTSTKNSSLANPFITTSVLAGKSFLIY